MRQLSSAVGKQAVSRRASRSPASCTERTSYMVNAHLKVLWLHNKIHLHQHRSCSSWWTVRLPASLMYSGPCAN